MHSKGVDLEDFYTVRRISDGIVDPIITNRHLGEARGIKTVAR